MEMPKFVPQVAKQTIGFHKNIFQKSFDTLMALNEQMLKMLEKVPGFPEGGKSVIVDLNNSFKKISVDFKSTVDQKIFKRAEELFATEKASAKKAAARPKAKKAAKPARKA